MVLVSMCFSQPNAAIRVGARSHPLQPLALCLRPGELSAGVASGVKMSLYTTTIYGRQLVYGDKLRFISMTNIVVPVPLVMIAIGQRFPIFL